MNFVRLGRGREKDKVWRWRRLKVSDKHQNYVVLMGFSYSLPITSSHFVAHGEEITTAQDSQFGEKGQIQRTQWGILCPLNIKSLYTEALWVSNGD